MENDYVLGEKEGRDGSWEVVQGKRGEIVTCGQRKMRSYCICLALPLACLTSATADTATVSISGNCCCGENSSYKSKEEAA